ncbi:MAG: alpha/beta hydrolase [Spirochaetales bacterium]|nr:alpha/beta hydrolase [Spirochaetales bacterium]
MLVLLICAAAAVALLCIAAADREKTAVSDDIREARNTPFITLSQGTTAYRLTAHQAGTTVVCVHGGTVPSWSWNLLRTVLENAGFRVLTYDMYGRGLSDRPAVTYAKDLYLSQLKELVDTLGLDRPFHLIGLSLGGATAVNFTAAYHEYVDKLVLISPVINDFPAPGIFRIPVVGEIAARLFGVSVITRRFKTLVSGNPEFSGCTALFDEQTRYKGFRRSLLSMLRHDALADYDEAYKRVGLQNRESLLVWGTDDTEISEAMIADVRACIPSIGFHPVPGAGHGVLFEQHEEVNTAITAFLVK